MSSKTTIVALVEQLENGAAEERVAAADALAQSHDIMAYPHLRVAVMNDDEEKVRKAALTALGTLEDEFGEDACLAVQAEAIGTHLENSQVAQDAAAAGNFYGISLNNFR